MSWGHPPRFPTSFCPDRVSNLGVRTYPVRLRGHATDFKLGHPQGRWSGRADLTTAEPPTSASIRFVLEMGATGGLVVRPGTGLWAE
jgi:hypothetical protein